MEFEADKVDDFLSMFNSVKDKIKAVEGCERLTLYRDLDQPHIFFTYSFWGKAENLEAYRTSTLFTETWSYTKSLFASKAKAWSVEDVVTLL